MKNNRSLLLLLLASCVVSLIFVGSAAASPGFLQTPTRDPRTPPATPTPGGQFEIGVGSNGDSYACPSGGVEGYGQVTPDAMWMAVCGQCIPTTTAFPTYDLDSFPTRTPVIWVSGTPATPGPHMELTYTPVSTLTPFSTVTPFPVTANPTQTACGGFTINSTGIGLSNASGFATTGSISCVPEGTNYRCTGTLTQYDTHGTTDSQMMIIFSSTGLTGGNDLYISGSVALSASDGYVNNNLGTYFTGFGFYGSYSTIPVNKVLGASGSGEFSMNFQGGGYNNLLTYTVNLLFSRSAICATMPTPTVTPISTPITEGYCSSINNGMGDLTNQDMTFWTPAGPAACLIIPSLNTTDLFNFEEMPGWIGIFLGGVVQVDRIQEMIEGFLGGYQIYTSAMTLCLQPYEFAPVNLFGNILLFQTIADIGLIIYGVRLLRSR